VNVPATTEKKPITLRERIDGAAPEFKKALPGHIPVEKFVRTVQTAITMQPAIAEAANSREGLQSLMTACTKAATDGLILDGREAALVTFKGAVQYMPMVAGLMKKARNSGDISSITAEIVYKNDPFSYNPSVDDAPDHRPEWFGDRGEPVGVYAVCRLKDGSTVVEIMSARQVMNIASQSRNAGQYDPRNGKNYGEWWRKTVIRRISKYLPSSSDKDEFMQAVSRVDEEFDYTDAPTEAVPNPPVKKRGAGAAALKDITPEPATTPEPVVQPTPTEEPHDPITGEIVDDHAQQAGDDI
jgi:recombination protein RecT